MNRSNSEAREGYCKSSSKHKHHKKKHKKHKKSKYSSADVADRSIPSTSLYENAHTSCESAHKSRESAHMSRESASTPHESAHTSSHESAHKKDSNISEDHTSLVCDKFRVDSDGKKRHREMDYRDRVRDKLRDNRDEKEQHRETDYMDRAYDKLDDRDKKERHRELDYRDHYKEHECYKRSSSNSQSLENRRDKYKSNAKNDGSDDDNGNVRDSKSVQPEEEQPESNIGPDYEFNWDAHRYVLDKIFFQEEDLIKRGTAQYDDFWAFLIKYQLFQRKKAECNPGK